jgi:hypothetical protein
LVSKPLYEEYVKACSSDNEDECSNLSEKIWYGIGNLNPYALDYPVCLSDTPSRFGRAQRLWFKNQELLNRGFAPHALKAIKIPRLEEYQPCEVIKSTDFLYMKRLTIVITGQLDGEILE